MISDIRMHYRVDEWHFRAVGVFVKVAAFTVQVNDLLFAEVKKHSKILIVWRAFLVYYKIEQIPLHS